MITYWVLKILCGVLTGILGLFPSYELPESVKGLGGKLGAGINTIDGVFPIVQLGLAIGVVVAVWLFRYGVSLIAYVYNKIPFKAT